jgi:hypothetical protein
MRKALRRLLAHGREAESRHDTAPQPYQSTLRDAAPARQQSDGPETGPPASADRIFQYTPLSGPSRFRILHLKRDLDWVPSDTDTGYYHDVRLCGSLYEASIDSVPEYFALSYTWGDATVSEYIKLDGNRFGIGANCAAALRRMLRGKMEVHIWVDAICINQADTPEALDERSGQVAMMDEIYKASSRVNVHLGEGDRDTEVAMQLLKKLATAYLGAKMGSGHSRKEYERLADDALGQLTQCHYVAKGTNEHSPETTTKYPYGKLHPVFRLPWFRRVWVCN